MSYSHSTLFIASDRNSLREKGLSWITVSESSFYLGGEDKMVGACGRSRTGSRVDYNLQRATSNDLLLPGHSLKVPQPSKIMPQLGTKYSKHQPVGDFEIQMTTLFDN